MTQTDQELLRVVYFSHHISDQAQDLMAWEIDAILEKSQINNQRAGVTGALIFNAGVFGQVLEGPVSAVEETFERIQMDERHDEITVLELCRVNERAFSQWSMGYVGADRMSAELFGRVGEKTDFDIARLDGQQIFETLRALTVKNEVSTRVA